jgi:hypothetical protein
VAKSTVPNLDTSLSARAILIAHKLASKLSALSEFEQGWVEEEFNGTFDIHIEKQKRSGEYCIKVTAYDRKRERKKESGKVCFKGNVEKVELYGINFISLVKEGPGKKVKISRTKRLFLCENPTKDEIRDYIEDAISENEEKLEKIEDFNTQDFYALIKAVIAKESNFEHCWEEGGIKKSKSGALGLMQLKPKTAEILRVNPYRPDENIRGGVKHFGDGLWRVFKDYNDRVRLAVARYNCGKGIEDLANKYCKKNGIFINCWNEIKDKIGPGKEECPRAIPGTVHPKSETLDYVEGVIEYYEYYKDNPNCYDMPENCRRQELV